MSVVMSCQHCVRHAQITLWKNTVVMINDNTYLPFNTTIQIQSKAKNVSACICEVCVCVCNAGAKGWDALEEMRSS